jgi:2,5-diamino-6-(ribosylamino)-4(3H)-pyrimidinone 5'-phosphate reductase
MTKPKVVIFNAVSLDGRMDGGLGEVQMGLYYQTAAHWNADAMLSGSSTILTGLSELEASITEDLPIENKELHPMAIPYLVVVDSHGRIHNWRVMRAQPYWREVIVLCSQSTPSSYLDGLEQDGVPFVVAGVDRVDLAQALETLHERFGIQTVRVDSGGILNGVLLRLGLVDEVSLLVWPALVGGETPRSFFTAPDITTPEQVIPLRLVHCEHLADDVLWLKYEVPPSRRVGVS